MLDLIDLVEDKKLRDRLIAAYENEQDKAVTSAANALNIMVEKDPTTVNNLICNLVQCGPALIDSPAELIQIGEASYAIGLIGILNGVLHNRKLKIIPIFSEPSKGSAVHFPVSGFSVVDISQFNPVRTERS